VYVVSFYPDLFSRRYLVIMTSDGDSIKDDVRDTGFCVGVD